MTKYIKNEYGFTLIEIMVSMVISSLVIAGVYGVYTIQQRSYTVQEQVSEMQQRIRAAVDFMSREMRIAGYDPPAPYDPTAACDGATILIAQPGLFSFQYCEVVNTNPKDPEEIPRIYTSAMQTSTYQLSNGVLSKNSIAIAEGIDAIEFQYRRRGGTVLPAPVANPRDIHAVEISVLVRSTYPDPKYTNTTVYKPASVIEAEKKGETVPDWDINGTEAGTGNPPNDNFHRRLLIKRIYLRNMGVQQ